MGDKTLRNYKHTMFHQNLRGDPKFNNPIETLEIFMNHTSGDHKGWPMKYNVT